MNIQTFHSSSAGNLYRVSDILIDPGVPIRQIKKCLDYRLCDIKACLISHEHQDHIRGAKDLIRCGVDIYASQGTADAALLSGHRVHTIEAGKQFHIGTWTILPFATIHNAAEPLGFLLFSEFNGEKLIYAVDTQFIPYRFQGLTHIMIEANYDIELLLNSETRIEVKKNVLNYHMSIETAKEFLRTNDMSRVEEIHLLHLSNNNSDARQFIYEIQHITGRPVYIRG
ncbi:hypothetical protein LCGC14_0911080 [marine sediment metagenome]|uniref:Metallo-beta-lactamase domain-containing protein n=1 Tax=marine sediment metagenome TaxID=412755 RepID=A0A0F9PEG0_9ZZZZ|nr:MBL fold metallo-hydrolase [Candidatus Aminicenantes bacterium]